MLRSEATRSPERCGASSNPMLSCEVSDSTNVPSGASCDSMSWRRRASAASSVVLEWTSISGMRHVVSGSDEVGSWATKAFE